ncbi:hypothetical protein CISG_05144 [Coccidioides immitis RMSCC 3703]|uniref:Uncharacterized protein n=2 Tax=Coccidioides immitis TaxID=5501 RepID=A0A0J8QSQ5_COCIT|nr:hypothetical protein CIRG_01350 [Coccidioides immitis RMSCC 2394]KMU75511.1 hypothetical protein CISG_05144 [Coccidioides immitis RMSCC 3703]
MAGGHRENSLSLSLSLSFFLVAFSNANASRQYNPDFLFRNLPRARPSSRPFPTEWLPGISAFGSAGAAHADSQDSTEGHHSPPSPVRCYAILEGRPTCDPGLKPTDFDFQNPPESRLDLPTPSSELATLNAPRRKGQCHRCTPESNSTCAAPRTKFTPRYRTGVPFRPSSGASSIDVIDHWYYGDKKQSLAVAHKHGGLDSDLVPVLPHIVAVDAEHLAS